MIRRVCTAAPVSAAVVLATTLAGAGFALGAGGARASVDPAADPASLAQPDARYGPRWYWWWPGDAVDPAEIDAELEAVRAAGFSGVQQTMLRNPRQWWSRLHRRNLVRAARKATELGLKLDVNLGPGWPMSAKVATDQSNRFSMQEAVVSSVDVVGPRTFVGRVPARDDGGLRRRTLVAVTAAQPVAQDRATPNPTGGRATSVRVALRPETSVDLTAQVRGGLVRWSVPPGRWKLFGVWSRMTGWYGQGGWNLVTDVLQPEPLGIPLGRVDGRAELVIDHFGRAATDATLREYDRTLFDGELADAMARNGGSVYDNSLELKHGSGYSRVDTLTCGGCTAEFWTPRLIEEFRARRGYDPTRLLPALFAPFELADGGHDRLRRDYDDTMEDLLVDAHYRPIRAWAGRRGIGSRAQGYTFERADKTRLAAALELPDAETLDAGDLGDVVEPGSARAQMVRDSYRAVVSGAHLSGAREISLENGATPFAEYAMRPADYHAMANRAFAAGVTTMVVHGFAYRTYRDRYQAWTWPGWSAFSGVFAQSWNQSLPQFAHWPGITAAWSRVGAALQSGRPAVEVVVLNAVTGRSFSATRAPVYGTADTNAALARTTLTWGRIGDASFTELPAPVDGRLLPDGPGYRAIVVDDLAALSAPAAERLLLAAQRGVGVVVKGRVADRGISYANPDDEDARVRASMAGLLALPNVRRVERGDEIAGALAALGVRADLEAPGLPIVAQHRRTPGGDVWYLLNDSRGETAGDLTFRASGTPSVIDPWTGGAQLLHVTPAGDGRTTVPLRLGPGQAVLVAFSREPSRAAPSDTRLAVQVTPGRRAAPATVTGPWRLEVRSTSPTLSGRRTLTLPRLRDWRRIPELQGVSGTGTYTAAVDVPPDWLAAGRGVLIDAGAVGGTMQITINGRPARLPTTPDGPRDVSALLRPGPNTLSVEVATSLINQLGARGRAGDPRYLVFAAQRAQPAGLLGPVTLTPYSTGPG